MVNFASQVNGQLLGLKNSLNDRVTKKKSFSSLQIEVIDAIVTKTHRNFL